MKFSLLTLAFAAAIPAAFASPVTYDTLQTQLCIGAIGCNQQSQQFGGAAGVTVSFTPLTDTTVDPKGTWTFASFGRITITCTAGGEECGSQSLAGLNLYIVIDQSSPLVGSGNIPGGVITGSIQGDSSSAMITWPNPAVTSIGGFAYSIVNNPLALVPVTSGGKTTIQGMVTETVVPEPSTYLMLSAGLLGLGLRRKFAKRAA